MKIGIMSLTLMILLSCGLAEAQSDVTYLGEFCVVDNSPLGRPPVPLFKVGILYYGDNHLALNGEWQGGIPEPVYGSAMISGENLVATLNSSLASDTYGISYRVSYLTVNLTPQDGSTMMFFGTITFMTTTYHPTPAQQPAVQLPIYMVPCNP